MLFDTVNAPMANPVSSDELREAIKNAGGVAAVVRASDINAQTLYSFMKVPSANLRGDNLEKVLRGLKKLAGEVGDIATQSEEYQTIPIFDLAASAGDGGLVAEGDVLGYQPFRAQQLSRITSTPLSRLAVIMVRGDSMDPTLAHQDLILVDTSFQKVGRDGIYILALEDELLVKRCWVDLDTGAIIVKSDNPQYGTQTVTDKDRLDIKGRVIWIGRALG